MLSIYLFLGLFAFLANCTPGTLYRADKRGPDVIHKAGGFITRAHTNNAQQVCSLADHQSQTSANDPFISTSASGERAAGFLAKPPNMGNGWLYEIDSSKAGVKFHDCAKVSGTHQNEQEFAAEGNIPDTAIIACTEYTRNKPGKRITGCRPAPNPKPNILAGYSRIYARNFVA